MSPQITRFTLLLALLFAAIPVAVAPSSPQVEELATHKEFAKTISKWHRLPKSSEIREIRNELTQAAVLAMRTRNNVECGKIAIIGSGMSAMSAADRILQINPKCKIDMYEARERIGGRTYWLPGLTDMSAGADSKVGGNGQWVKNSDYTGSPIPEESYQKGFDLGGQWCHMNGPDNPLSRLIKRQKLKSSVVGSPYGDNDKNTVFYDKERNYHDVTGVADQESTRPILDRTAYINSMHMAHDIFNEAQEKVIASKKDKSVQDAINEHPKWKEILKDCESQTPAGKSCLMKELLTFHFNIIVDFEGAETLGHTGIQSYEIGMAYPAGEEDAEMVGKLGMFGTTNSLFQSIVSNPNFKLNLGCKVETVKNLGFKPKLLRRKGDPEDKKIKRKMDEAEIFFKCKGDEESKKEGYTQVLSTVPFGVMQRDHATLFPQLPKEKKDILDKTSPAPLLHGTLNKLILMFNECWWPNEDYTWSFLTGHSRYKFIVNFCHSNSKKKPVLIFFTAATDAHDVEAESPKKQKDAALVQLRKMFPDLTVPEPAEIVVSRWWNDPHSVGSYLTLGVGGTQDQIRTLRRPDDSIHYAGEWTDPVRYGFVFGAFMAGQRAAFEMVGPHFGVGEKKFREHVWKLYDTNTQNTEIYEGDPGEMFHGASEIMNHDSAIKNQMRGKENIQKIGAQWAARKAAQGHKVGSAEDVISKTKEAIKLQKEHIGFDE